MTNWFIQSVQINTSLSLVHTPKDGFISSTFFSPNETWLPINAGQCGVDSPLAISNLTTEQPIRAIPLGVEHCTTQKYLCAWCRPMHDYYCLQYYFLVIISTASHLHIGLNSKQQIGHHPLMHVRPTKLWDPVRCLVWSRAEEPRRITTGGRCGCQLLLLFLPLGAGQRTLGILGLWLGCCRPGCGDHGWCCASIVWSFCHGDVVVRFLFDLIG